MTQTEEDLVPQASPTAAEKTETTATTTVTPAAEAAAETKYDFYEFVTAPPDWLTQDYFEKALQSYEKDGALKVIDDVLR